MPMTTEDSLEFCKHCSARLPLDPNKRHGLYCDEPCFKARNRTYMKAYRKQRYYEHRKVVDELKSKPCMDCGGTFPPCCMDFDHRPDEIKLCNVSQGLAKLGSMKKLLEEAAKCDLVCANCHRIRTAKRQATITPGLKQFV